MRKERSDTHICAVTGQQLPERQLIRFVLDPDHQVVPDIGCKLPGNSVWIACEQSAISLAVDQGVFAERFGSRCRVQPDLIQNIEKLLHDSVLGMLSLAKKAGCVVSGFVKVEAALRSSRVAFLLHATQAAANGREKLDSLARHMIDGEPGSQTSFSLLTGDEMEQALGGTNIRHVAVLDGGLAGKLKVQLERLDKFTGCGRQSR